MGIRREAFEHVGGFDESLPPYGGEDGEFSIRVNKAGLSVCPAPEMILHFRQTEDTRRLAIKIFQAGVAETVVWARDPDIYGDLLSWKRLIVRFALVGYAALRVLTSHKRRSELRDLVRRVANLWGRIRLLVDPKLR